MLLFLFLILKKERGKTTEKLFLLIFFFFFCINNFPLLFYWIFPFVYLSIDIGLFYILIESNQIKTMSLHYTFKWYVQILIIFTLPLSNIFFRVPSPPPQFQFFGLLPTIHVEQMGTQKKKTNNLQSKTIHVVHFNGCKE